MKLFIGCSSSNDIPKEYIDDCSKLLQKLMKNNDLVFGAYDEGIMGVAYNTTLKLGGKVTGICPEIYKEDLETLNCDEEIITSSIGERTEMLIKSCDALVFLPGGLGTIHELLAAIDSKRCKEFDKLIIIYNSNGFFDKLLDFIDKIYDEKFSKVKEKNKYVVTNSIDEVLNVLLGTGTNGTLMG